MSFLYDWALFSNCLSCPRCLDKINEHVLNVIKQIFIYLCIYLVTNVFAEGSDLNLADSFPFLSSCFSQTHPLSRPTPVSSCCVSLRGRLQTEGDLWSKWLEEILFFSVSSLSDTLTDVFFLSVIKCCVDQRNIHIQLWQRKCWAVLLLVDLIKILSDHQVCWEWVSLQQQNEIVCRSKARLTRISKPLQVQLQLQLESHPLLTRLLSTTPTVVTPASSSFLKPTWARRWRFYTPTSADLKLLHHLLELSSIFSLSTYDPHGASPPAGCSSASGSLGGARGTHAPRPGEAPGYLLYRLHVLQDFPPCDPLYSATARQHVSNR